MDNIEIDAVRALLSAKPRPVGWAERRERIDGVRPDAALTNQASDVTLETRRSRRTCRRMVHRAGKRRVARSAVFSWRRLLLGVHP